MLHYGNIACGQPIVYLNIRGNINLICDEMNSYLLKYNDYILNAVLDWLKVIYLETLGGKLWMY